jgi:hypothetical protein
LDKNNKQLKEQYLSMKDQYLTALDHRFLMHTNQLFEKHYAPILSIYQSRYSVTNYVQDLYRSLTGKPTQGQRALMQTSLLRKEMNIDEQEELVDRIIVFNREKKSSMSF